MPGDPARDLAAEDDRYLDWLTAEVDAGRIEVPPDEPPPGAPVSLGEAGDVGLDELAAMAVEDIHSEIDHTMPYPAGATDQCNLAPLCSRHHHAKHAPGWKLQQPEPGVMQWTLPSGRIHTTRPTKYDE
jgi:hypothetical protein